MLDMQLYRALYRIRRVEEEIAQAYPSDKITSPIHLSIGQEAVAVGVCQSLRPEDVVFGSYRCHAYYLAKEGSLRGMLAELYGKATGVAKGKAGSMHLIDPSAGVMGASAIVASTIPQAVGYAMALKNRGERRVVAVFFGDGATEEGVFYESLNFAALHRLPILFICENNFYAIHSHQADRQAVPDICRRAAAHGVLTERFEEPDIYRLYARTCQMAEELRGGQSLPVLLECHCYRWMEHVGPGQDFAAGYRSRADLEHWRAVDALAQVGRNLPRGPRRKIEQEVEEEIHDAFTYAECSPFPAAEELYADVYA
jgi:TPP-dependent pyruvate/acetoin dehydrogenase alpha subunit